MARRPLTRIDGGEAETDRSPPPGARAPPAGAELAAPPARHRAPRRIRSPQLWIGAACAASLLALLAAGSGREQTGRAPVERAPAASVGAVTANVQVPASDTRSVRQICADEGVPGVLCARSVDCATPAPAGRPRVVRLFLQAPQRAGCN